MANQLQTIPNDVFVQGTLRATTMVVPAASVSDASVIALAKIQASKLQHQYEQVFRQSSTTVATNDQQCVHVVFGATATLLDVSVGNVTAATGTGAVTVDLLKNGVSVLTGAITLNSATAAYALLAGSLASTALVVGDVLEVKLSGSTAGSGSKPTGVYVRVTLVEDAQ